MSLRIGIDIGGTFTDLVAISDDGRVATHKTASTPHDYGEGIIDGIQALLSREPGPVTEVLHATTVGSNVVLEAKGRPHGADHHARVPRHSGNSRPAHAGAVRSALDQAAGFGGAPPASGGHGKDAAGWLGVGPARPCQRLPRHRPAARRTGRKCRDLPAAQLRQSVA
jgi:hypothetical protein